MELSDRNSSSMATGPFTDNTLHLLQIALSWWQHKGGFTYVDLPWIVPRVYSDATRPADSRDISTPHGSFVGSGEQSFLQLWTEGRLLAGAPGYIGWTPCLRDEEHFDELHQHGFMKAEWFVPLDPCGGDRDRLPHLNRLVAQQLRMFFELAIAAGGPSSLPLTREVFRPDQIDLLLAGIEIGSYGIREFSGREYIYGTALALPRFTQALERAPSISSDNQLAK